MSTARRVGVGLAGGAALVAAVTLVARLVGFGRQLVFQDSVGQTQLGDVYVSANYVPAILFEIVAGGALAGVVIPLVVGAVDGRDERRLRQTTAALLGWVVVVLIPLALLAGLLAGPISDYLLGDSAGADAEAMATRMLQVFVWQIPLYGIAAVTAGVLQAHRRFLAAALAPILSSLVVATAYLVFAADFTGDRNDLSTVQRSDELILSVGTLLGAAALALTTLVPLLASGLRVMPRLRFPAGQGRRAARLATAGVAMVAAQQVAVLLLIPIINVQGGDGRLVTYQNSWMVYLLPYAVLAVPIAISSYPALAGHAERGDREAYAATTAASTRAVLMAAAVGAALLAGTAWPVARFFGIIGDHGTVPDAEMARALVAFAPGLLGFALVYHLNRALLSIGRTRAVGAGTAAGWAVVVLAAYLGTRTVDQGWVVATIGAAHSLGMFVAAGLLLLALRRAEGAAVLRGVVPAAALAVVAAAAGGVAGSVVAGSLGEGGTGRTVAVGVLAGVAAAVVSAGVLAALARHDLAALLRRGRHR